MHYKIESGKPFGIDISLDLVGPTDCDDPGNYLWKSYITEIFQKLDSKGMLQLNELEKTLQFSIETNGSKRDYTLAIPSNSHQGQITDKLSEWDGVKTVGIHFIDGSKNVIYNDRPNDELYSQGDFKQIIEAINSVQDEIHERALEYYREKEAADIDDDC